MQARRRWWWTAIGAVAVIGFLAFLQISVQQAATPVGLTPGAGGMPGMSMGGRGAPTARLTLRDMEGGRHPLPERARPGALVFIQGGRCDECVSATKKVRTVAARVQPDVDVHAISVDPADTRADIAAFRRAAQAPGLPVILETRSGDLSTHFDAPPPGTVLVYDRSGRIVARLSDPRRGSLARAFARARRS